MSPLVNHPVKLKGKGIPKILFDFFLPPATLIGSDETSQLAFFAPTRGSWLAPVG
jgi:hypothetical protein